MFLNNHGWGMRDMLIYSCIILLFLLIATYYIKSLYKGLSFADSNSTNEVIVEEEEEKPSEYPINYDLYNDYEGRMNNAAINYVRYHYGYLDTGIASINLYELVADGYIEDLYSQRDGSKCIGYSNVWDDEVGEFHASSYINCTGYMTEGYIG